MCEIFQVTYSFRKNKEFVSSNVENLPQDLKTLKELNKF